MSQLLNCRPVVIKYFSLLDDILVTDTSEELVHGIATANGLFLMVVTKCPKRHD